VPPQSLESEQAILGAMLIEARAVRQTRAILRAEMFYRESHQILYRVIERMEARGEAIDLTTVATALESEGKLERAGGKPYLATLLDCVPTAAHAEYYSKAIERAYTLRELIRTCAAITEDCYAEHVADETEDLISSAPVAIQAIAQGRYRDAPLLRQGQMMDETLEFVNRAMAGEDTSEMGAPTGLPELDSFLGGICPGHYVVIGGETSSGKSALAYQISGELADQGQKGLIFSFEMKKRDLGIRQIQARAGISSQRLKRGNLDAAMYGDVTHAVRDLRRRNLTYVTVEDVTRRHRRATPAVVRDIAREEMAERGLDFVVVDYLQLLSPDRKTDSRAQEVSQISRELANLSKELGVAIFALSQFSRSKEGGRPDVNRLKESGDVENDADEIILIYSPNREGRFRGAEQQYSYDPDGRSEHEVELIIAKNRNGPCGIASLLWQPETVTFLSPERRAQEEVRMSEAEDAFAGAN
jgi:replicative DNA helicase